MRWNVPNAISFFRVVLVPVLMAFLLADVRYGDLFALAVFILAAASDSLDGYLARRFRQTSALGAFLDPLADKLLVLGALAAMAALGQVTWAPVALLAVREVVITSYRVVVARRGVSVPARRVAKAKTLVEFLTVALLLLPVAWPSRLTFSHLALWLAVVLAWASAVQYLVDSRSGRRAVATGA